MLGPSPIRTTEVGGQQTLTGARHLCLICVLRGYFTVPAPRPVRLTPYDPLWAEQASAEAARVLRACDPAMISVHHIGSTSIPGIVAKPVLDLLGVATALADLDAKAAALGELGYASRGEHGIVGRRYFTLDGVSGERRAQLHCFARGDPGIERHLAFRDHLRGRPELAHEYEREKVRCATRHPEDSLAYTECKDAWIRRVQAEALALR